MSAAADLCRQAAASPHLRLVGLACHIGSQLTELAPFAAAIERMMALVGRLADLGIEIGQIDAELAEIPQRRRLLGHIGLAAARVVKGTGCRRAA